MSGFFDSCNSGAAVFDISRTVQRHSPLRPLGPELPNSILISIINRFGLIARHELEIDQIVCPDCPVRPHLASGKRATHSVVRGPQNTFWPRNCYDCASWAAIPTEHLGAVRTRLAAKQGHRRALALRACAASAASFPPLQGAHARRPPFPLLAVYIRCAQQADGEAQMPGTLHLCS